MEIAADVLILEDRTRLLESLYKTAFPKVATFVANRGGTFDDARDIFHDALVIFYEKASDEVEAIKTSEEHYVIGIAKHLWLRKYKTDLKFVQLTESEKAISIPEGYFHEADNRLVSILSLTGRKCMELLQAFYYENLSLRQIKSLFSFSTVHSASVQKFKCIEKVRETIKKKSIGYEELR